MNWELVHLLIDAAITLALFYVGSKTSKIDKLEERLTQTANDLVDARFRVVNAEMKAPAAMLQAIVGEMQKRLERGDNAFAAQNEISHRLELKTQAHVGEVRNWAMATFATREELQAIGEAARAMELSLAACQARCQTGR